MNKASAPENGIGEPARWSLRLIGGFGLSLLPGGERVASPGKRERALLAYLALSPKGRQPRRKLAALIWGDATDETLLDNLRTCIWRLRKALGDADHRLLVSDDEDIVLNTAAFDVDVLAFRRLAAQSGRSELETAANLCGGEFLDGLELDSEEFESWRRAEETRYRDQAVDVLSRLMTLLNACAETERSLEMGTKILRLEPLHEATARHMMKLYAQSGRRGTAIQIYRTLAEALRTDVNTQPAAETRLIFAEIARAGDEQPIGPAHEDALPPERPTSAMEPSDAPAGPLPPARPTFRLRVPLAVLAGALIVAIALLSFWRVAPGPIAGTADIRQPGIAAPIVQTAALTIAVLPFDNLSGDPKQELFSDGLTQEVTTALAKIPGLRVIGHDSVSQFKSQPPDAAAIGKQLGVAYLVRGTVQTSGQSLLIAASLIGSNGKIVWTQNYDRSVTDAFAVQEQLAQAIAAALHLPFQPGMRALNPAIDPDSYQQYLAAKRLGHTGYVGIQQTMDILEPLVARYPRFAPASALLAGAYVYASLGPGGTVLWPKAEAAARRAIASDPALADGYVALASLQLVRGKLIEADDLLRIALGLNPENSDALGLEISLFGDVGRVKDALANAERLRVLEPAAPVFKAAIGRVLWENGRNNEAIEVLKPVLEFGAVRPELAMIYASMGRYSEAADLIEHDGAEHYRGQAVQAARILRAAPAKAPAEDTDPPLRTRPFPVDFVYLYTGYPERALGSFEEVIKSGKAQFIDLLGLVWHPSYAPVRKTARFKQLMRDVGNVDYWRVKGWPEFCQPTTGDDFICH